MIWRAKWDAVMGDTMGDDPWYSGHSNGHPSLHLMMGEVRQKLVDLCDDVSDLTIDTREQFRTGHDRMDKHEALILEVHNQLKRASPIKSFVAAALAVMPLREWLIGLLLGVMVLKGLISPAEIKAWILSTPTPP